MKKKHVLCLLLGFCLMLWGCGSAAEPDLPSGSGAPESPSGSAPSDGPLYADGTYQGTARGFRRGLNLEVTVTNGRVSAVTIGEHSEDEPYMTDASVVIEKVIETNSTDGIDAVSGATKTCQGILDAIDEALKKAQ